MTPADVAALVVAALGGTAIGLERQWSGHAAGPEARFGGIRTFTMVGACGGLSGWLWAHGAPGLGAVLLAGVVGLVVAAYIAASRQDVDGTTEAAALIVVAAGVLAGLGATQVASGIIALLALVLLEKTRLHVWVARIDDVELRAAALFAAMALVVLPLLPAGPYGPSGAVRPRELWMLVLFFSGLSFTGHLLRRTLGPERGYLIGGMAGGLVSSTNVTWTFARLSRDQPDVARALALGAVGANVMLYPRVLVATGVLAPALLAPLLMLLGPAAIVGLLVVGLGMWRSRRDDAARAAPAAEASGPANPLQLWNALQMGALFQAVILIVHLARGAWGQSGLLATAAALGLTDVDALTVSITRQVAPTAAPRDAALALAVGILSNTALKAILAWAAGSRRYRAVVGGTLLLMAAAMGMAIGVAMSGRI